MSVKGWGDISQMVMFFKHHYENYEYASQCLHFAYIYVFFFQPLVWDT